MLQTDASKKLFPAPLCFISLPASKGGSTFPRIKSWAEVKRAGKSSFVRGWRYIPSDHTTSQFTQINVYCAFITYWSAPCLLPFEPCENAVRQQHSHFLLAEISALFLFDHLPFTLACFPECLDALQQQLIHFIQCPLTFRWIITSDLSKIPHFT